MIKVVLQTSRGPMLLFGLTKTNVERLKAGDPIHIDCGELGVHGVTVVIMYGDTQTDITDELESVGVISADVAAAARAGDDGQRD